MRFFVLANRAGMSLPFMQALRMTLVPLGLGLGQLTLSGPYALFGLTLDAAVILTTLMQ